MKKINYSRFDTERLMYEIEIIYEDFYGNKEFFDSSKYSKDSKNITTNKLVVGKRRDENCDVPIKSFVGLKSKMYTYMTEDEYESKKQKVLVRVLLKMN